MSFLNSLRQKAAYGIAKSAVRSRSTVAAPLDPHQARVLVVLPTDEYHSRAAWKFILEVETPRQHIQPVVFGERVSYAPDAFAGRVKTITPRQQDWRRLPEKDVVSELWGREPHVAIDFSYPFSLASAYLCGASPALFRIALYSEDAEPFYDFLLAPQQDLSAAYDAMKSYLKAVEPPVLAFKEPNK